MGDTERPPAQRAWNHEGRPWREWRGRGPANVVGDLARNGAVLTRTLIPLAGIIASSIDRSVPVGAIIGAPLSPGGPQPRAL